MCFVRRALLFALLVLREAGMCECVMEGRVADELDGSKGERDGKREKR